MSIHGAERTLHELVIAAIAFTGTLCALLVIAGLWLLARLLREDPAAGEEGEEREDHDGTRYQR